MPTSAMPRTSRILYSSRAGWLLVTGVECMKHPAARRRTAPPYSTLLLAATAARMPATAASSMDW
jgi:hypothetical protein